MSLDDGARTRCRNPWNLAPAIELTFPAELVTLTLFFTLQTN